MLQRIHKSAYFVKSRHGTPDICGYMLVYILYFDAFKGRGNKFHMRVVEVVLGFTWPCRIGSSKDVKGISPRRTILSDRKRSSLSLAQSSGNYSQVWKREQYEVFWKDSHGLCIWDQINPPFRIRFQAFPTRNRISDSISRIIFRPIVPSVVHGIILDIVKFSLLLKPFWRCGSVEAIERRGRSFHLPRNGKNIHRA